jgi:hypothetical protein
MSQTTRKQGFSYYICLMIERSGSGSGRPKNTWIRWIRIRIRILNAAGKIIPRGIIRNRTGYIFGPPGSGSASQRYLRIR